jgi:thiosulfate/3-mercaptopyruvate sulfurtransferase
MSGEMAPRSREGKKEGKEERRYAMKGRALATVAGMMFALLAIGSAMAAASDYAHPEALASTEWLAEHLDDPTVRVIAMANMFQPTPEETYTGGHIPGAVYLNLMVELADPDSAVPMMILPPEGFEALMGRLGINSGTTVVVYDDAGGSWAVRLWWALRYYGHETVKVLTGGLAKWIAEGRPLETEEIAPTPTTFKACVVPELRATIDDVKLALGDPNVRIIYAWDEARYLAGHIPSSVNLPAPSNLDPETMTVLPMDDLTQLWSNIDLHPDQLAITYCGGGIYGAFDLFILYLMGHERATLYDGSWVEWSANPGLPVETSPNDT